MAAQGKMPEAGAGARREAAPTAYDGGIIEAGRLVVLAKPLPSGAGAGAGYYTPFAVVRFEDLPEELRRQIAGAVGHGAAARPRDPNAAPAVAALLRGVEGDARYHAALPIDVVPRRQLPGLVSGPNDKDEPTVKFAGDGNRDAVTDYSESRVLRLVEDGKVLACLNASRLQFQGMGVGDMEGGLFDKEKGYEVCASGPKYRYKVVANDNSEPSNMAAQRTGLAYRGVFYDNGLPGREDAAPVVVALLDNNHIYIAGLPALDGSDGLTFAREDALPSVETLNGRATEEDIYNYDVLLPPENVVPVAEAEALRAPCPPTYAVQVRVDAAAGGQAGDPSAVSVKEKEAAGADAGHEHGSLSAVLGIVVASSAATALAAGTGGPATAFGLFAALVGGLSLAMASVRTRAW